MSKGYNVSIIGSGNLAWHLALAFEQAGHAIHEIASPTLEHAEKLVSKLYQAKAKNDFNFSESKANIFIIAVKDAAIIEVAKKLILPSHAFVAHTSGTTSIELLRRFENRAVFYPLQTFSKTRKIPFSDVPVILECSNEETTSFFTEFSGTLTSTIHFYNSEQRKIIHLAAVYACNFTNHLIGIATHILNSEEIPTTILFPVIAETVNKAMRLNPFEIQTGPAERKDKQTIEEHIDMLADVPEFAAIYKSISQSIIAVKNKI